MDRIKQKQLQIALALMLVTNNEVNEEVNKKIKDKVKSVELLKLFSNNYSKKVIDECLNSFPSSSRAEIKLNVDTVSTLMDVENNGLNLDFEAINKDIIEPLKKDLNSLLEKAPLHYTREKVGTKYWIKGVLIKNNYNSKSIDEFVEEVNSDNELLKNLKEIEKIIGTIGIYERLKAVETNGRIHTNFIPYSGYSGRIISHSPSTQNFPSEWKKYLKPLRENEFLFEIDLKSAEIFGLAKVIDETKVFEIMAKKDFYKHTTSKIFGIKEEDVNDIQRKSMKKVINAINYGIGGVGIAEILNESGICKSKISNKQGEMIKEEYFNLFPKFKEYQKEQSKTTELETLSGHIFKVRPSYKHIAFKPQNMIATLMKDLLIAINQMGYTENIINIVHDSIWISSTSIIANDIKNLMEEIFGALVEGTLAEGIELTKLTELGGGNKNV